MQGILSQRDFGHPGVQHDDEHGAIDAEIPAAFTHTTAPTLWRAAVISASCNLRARPPSPTQSTANRVSPSAALTWMLPRKRMTY
jgi:hypothetical protein